MTNGISYESALVALADPTRRAVFEALSNGAKPVGILAQNLPVSRPAVSQHLKVLGDAGLVQVRQVGTRRLYSIRKEGLEVLRRYLDQFWGDILDGFSNEITNFKQGDN